MGLKGKQWIKEIKKIKHDLAISNMRLGLEELKDWKPFREQFQWTGIFTLLEFLKEEEKEREGGKS